MDPDQIATPERTEQLRRSMAMLPSGQSWLTREDAILILERLVELQRWALGRTCCHGTDWEESPS